MQTTMRITETDEVRDLGQQREFEQKLTIDAHRYLFTGGVQYRIDHVSRFVQHGVTSQELHVTKM